MQESSSVLLSLHPQHAIKILSGEKKLEFRRIWATRPISTVVIYATVPVQKIVAIARVKCVHNGSPTALWELSKKIGGGLSRRKLYEYYEGRSSGFAIELDSVQRYPSPLPPEQFITGFRAPQSFSYVNQQTLNGLEQELSRQAPSGRILFVGGVHGVGKTTLCENYAKLHGIKHKSASQLIREEKATALSADSKAVKDIAGNQQLLIDAVRRIRATGETLLLDGHFALLDAKHQPQPVPTDVFSDLGIDGTVVIHDQPSAIASRMAARDNKPMTAKDIHRLQVLELSRAEQVARDLCIPFAKIKSTDQQTFNSIVGDLSGQSS